MKIKYRLYFLLLLFFASLTSVAQVPKFAYTNIATIIKEFSGFRLADNELNAYELQLRKKGQEMVKRWQQDSLDLENDIQKIITKNKSGQVEIVANDYEEKQAKLYKERMEKLMQNKKNINEFVSDIQYKVLKRQEELYSPLLAKVKQAMEAVAKEHGYSFIFDTNTNILLFAEEYLDVTKLIKAKLGL